MLQLDVDVLVVGGGPAGQAAALNLARFDRQVALFDTNHGRSSWHQTNHNLLGFPGGIPTRTLRERGRQQLSAYPQVMQLHYKIDTLERATGRFTARGQAGTWTARAVIVCTGVIDHYPHFAGWEDYVGRSMFWCIACDGYQCRDQRVVVVGNTNAAVVEALQLRRFTSHLTVLTDSTACRIDPAYRERLQRYDIPLIHDTLVQASGTDGSFEAIWTAAGRCIALDYLFTQHGATPQTTLAEAVGVLLSHDGYVCVDSEQKTNVAGVYAAGDVTRLHAHQVATAVHEGATAAFAANYDLYPPDLKA
jgi:thioredoxin reductase (NADPH)